MDTAVMDAQEIIVTVWKRKSEMLEEGKKPERLILSSDNYRKLRAYKIQLGELPHPEQDYLQKDSLFGIPVFIDNHCPLSVE